MRMQTQVFTEPIPPYLFRQFSNQQNISQILGSMSHSKEFDTSKLSYPILETLLFKHVTFKGVQLGSFIGAILVSPIVYYWSPKPVSPLTLGKALGISALSGIGLAGLLGVSKAITIDRDGLEDRVYRLNYNEGQNRWDQLSAIGILGGTAMAAVMGGFKPWILAGGAAIGCTIGTISHLATWHDTKNTGKQMVEEMKTS
eukprot:TRINITY_DN30847_c0_g1_i3.p3 TRINITY_DN30847_c0_g1~~TRINITY_DN30847_c0_g1_i3.p3  ORF type:complete len:200 (+),score=14.10 TRINITY_DN30847_c0_g1_i3:54-653(+)